MSYFKAKMHQIRFRLGLLLKWRHCFMFGQEKVKCASPCQMWGAGGWSPTHGGGLDAPVSCRCIRLTGDGERGICTAHVHGRWQRWSASQSGIGCHVVQVVTSTVLQTSTVLNDVEMLGLRPAQQTHFRPLTYLAYFTTMLPCQKNMPPGYEWWGTDWVLDLNSLVTSRVLDVFMCTL